MKNYQREQVAEKTAVNQPSSFEKEQVGSWGTAVSSPASFSGDPNSLHQQTNGNLARVGNVLLQLQNQFGNQYVQRVVENIQPAQRQELSGIGTSAQNRMQRQPRQPNHTTLPGQLKNNIEQMSGLDMSDVQVHRSSSKPAQISAHAYTQGSDIHLGPGQEKHLSHEAWHVVQQKQGRVRPNLLAHGARINDNPALEYEATDMGGKAERLNIDLEDGLKPSSALTSLSRRRHGSNMTQDGVLQRKIFIGWGKKEFTSKNKSYEKYENAGKGDRTFKDMTSPWKGYYFKNLNEMEEYMDYKTDTIGMLKWKDGNNYADSFQWIRLNPDKLYVLGESHGSSDNNTFPLIKALGTQRFMHEGYTEIPDQGGDLLKKEMMKGRKKKDDKTSNPQPLSVQGSEEEEKYAVKPNAYDHTGEAFLPKVNRALWGMDVTGAESQSPATVNMFGWALKYADANKNKAEFSGYANIKEKLQTLKGKMDKKYGYFDTDLITADKEQWEAFMTFRKAFDKHTETTWKKPDVKGWWRKKTTSDDYLGKESSTGKVDKKHKFWINEEYRDREMLAHIAKARENRYLIFGLGTRHLGRLAPVLKYWKDIKRMQVKELRQEQAKKYPKPKI